MPPTRDDEEAVREVRALAVALLFATAGMLFALAGCKSKPKVDERARALPIGGAVDLGVEAQEAIQEAQWTPAAVHRGPHHRNRF